jgi:DNA-binding PadR family transcriptional regulator
MGANEPLSPHRFHILVALADRDLHGSGVVRDVLDQTDGALRLWPATLYGLLDELESEGLITELTGDDRPNGVSERRRYYRITRAGRSALATEAARLSGLAGVAEQRLRRA